MAVPVFVLGHSGSGKSFSLHNLNPNNVGLINVVSILVIFLIRGVTY